MRKILFIFIALTFAGCNRSADEAPTPEPEPQPTEKICGGIAGIACGEGEYCHFEEGQCRIADGQGVCRPKTQFCTKDYRPVCGCDGKTYGNACTAASFGISVLHVGECAKEE